MRSVGAPDGPDSVPLTPQQHSLLRDAIAHPGTGRYVEQLVWRWHGPLDTGRFTRAWQAVFDRERVLRAAFDVRGEPRIVLYENARAEVVRHAAGTVAWDELVERDRLRGFDLGRPGMLRITLVDEPRHRRATAPPPPGSCSPTTTSCWTAGASSSCCRSSTGPTSPGASCPAASAAPTSVTTPAGWRLRTPARPGSSGPGP